MRFIEECASIGCVLLPGRVCLGLGMGSCPDLTASLSRIGLAQFNEMNMDEALVFYMQALALSVGEDPEGTGDGDGDGDGGGGDGSSAANAVPGGTDEDWEALFWISVIHAAKDNRSQVCKREQVIG